MFRRAIFKTRSKPQIAKMGLMHELEKSCARLADLRKLRETVIPLYLSCVPSPETCRAWFDGAGIPRFKANPGAKRGGGRCFYDVGAVEQFLRRTTAGPVFSGRRKSQPLK